MATKWKVQLLGCSVEKWLTHKAYTHDNEILGEAELSVVKHSNKHGQRSWGWPGIDKIVLPVEGLNPGSREERQNLYQKAQLICDAFNKADIE